MMYRIWLSIAACLLLSISSVRAAPPNVIYILADDVGYGDLGCYGSTKIPTPNLDRLAKEGTRFTDAHSPAAVCTPTRYSLLTGQYAFRHRPGSGILSGVAPLCIPTDRMTLPKLFQKQGYATAVVGKWHLGLGETEPDYNVEIRPGPKEVGFDRSFIVPATGDRTPCVYVENGRVVGLDPKDPIRVDYKQKVGTEPTGKENPSLLTNQKPSHGHDMTIVNGISRIGWMSGGLKARWVDEDMADTLTAKAVQFVEQHRDKPFFLYFATHDAHVPRCPHPRFRGKSQHGLRGDAIVELDWSVGQILDALDRLKLTSQTLVVFTSDNGGVMDDGYIDGTGTDTSGHSCNGLLRAKKGTAYEGGSRVPFLVRRPGSVPAGAVSGELICHVDTLATMAALLKQPLPADAAPDSFNVLPAWLQAKPGTSPRTKLITQAGSPEALSFRNGPWKLIVPAGKKKAPLPELYNLADDLPESTNLAAKHPDRVKEMMDELNSWKLATKTRPD
jgi:arylsulfatase A-like enzyme